MARFCSPSILQGSVWGALKGRWGWTVARLAWHDPHQVAAQILLRPLPLGGTFAYLPHGPLVAAAADTGVWAEALGLVGTWMRSAGVAFAKAELDVPADRRDIAGVLEAAGWRRSHEAIQFQNTMRSSLVGGEEVIRGALKQKTRYNVALAIRRGVTVRAVGEESLGVLQALYEETAHRDGFALREGAYYYDAWTAFLRSGNAVALLAEKDGRPLAAVFLAVLGRTAFYLYGASATEGRRDMPAYLAQWESMRWAAARGCTVYDWWGGPTTQDELDPLWGVQRYKLGFGAVLAERLGPWDLPLSPIRYGAYRRFTGLRRRALTLYGLGSRIRHAEGARALHSNGCSPKIDGLSRVRTLRRPPLFTSPGYELICPTTPATN